MSTPTTPAEEPGTGLPEEHPPTTFQRIASGSSTQIGLILVALIAVFSLLAFESSSRSRTRATSRPTPPSCSCSRSAPPT